MAAQNTKITQKKDSDNYYYAKSKRFAIVIFVCHFIAGMYSISKGMGESAGLILASGTSASVALYAHKQFTERKKLELYQLENEHKKSRQ